ncbi:MAG: hypothetical protein Q9217_006105 [Psora testacea]
MVATSFKQSGCGFKRMLADSLNLRDPLTRCLAPRLSRSIETETSLPTSHAYSAFTTIPARRQPPPIPDVITTVYSFPTFEPLRFATYPSNHLDLPLRRDILQRAIIFEADNARRGTASTKWRSQIHGSGRKVRPQKGTGSARLGDRKSPMLRGGGVAFGPKPRDFGTKLPRKIYDLAWRTALSYRYRKGELMIVQKFNDGDVTGWRWMEKVMKWNHLGKADGKSLIITRKSPGNLLAAMNTGPGASGGRHGEARADFDLDVKALLKLGSVVIEKRALDSILKEHSSDLNMTVPSAMD